MLSFAHTYRELDDKLESYLDFLSTPSARQFNEAIKSAWERAGSRV